ncbi:hypothetical protein F2Q70_00030178 [Brassica cretica]|uniref:CCHC-type domain-containing protein n=1 Tax=Brassica cretica TaxID=69181 RepID=A0A8S9FLK9_BRACR|nr:hypothetical protein F2Q70_00030178 [Brassica cretica]
MPHDMCAACVAAHAIGSMRADTQSLRSPSSKRSIPAHSRCQHCVLAKLSLIDKLLEHCELGIFGHIGRSPGCDVDTTGSMPHDGEDRILPIERMNTKSPGPKLECCVVLVYCVELALLCCVGGYGTLESVLVPRYGVISDRIVGYFGLSGLATRFWVEAGLRVLVDIVIDSYILFKFWVGVLSLSGFKETPYSLDREDSDERGHVLWLSITRWCNVAVTRRTVDCRAVTRRTVGRGRLKVPSSGLCGCKALSLELAGRVSGRTGMGRRVNFMTLAGLSLARHVALPDHGVGLDGQSCSYLIVGWAVDLSSPTLGCCTGVAGWIFVVMEDFDVLPSPTLADLFAPQDFDQVVPEMIPTHIIISDDESDKVAVPAPIIIISDDDTESDDDVLEIPSVAPPSPITIWSTGTTGETPSYDPAEDHGPSPATPEIGMPSWSLPLEAFELLIFPMSPGLPDPTYIPMTDEQYELETGWLTLFYQPMVSNGDSEDDPDMMITDDPFTQPIELPHYQPIFETGEPSSFPHAEDTTMELPFPEIIYDIGEPSSFPYMETATTALPLPQTTYETGGPSSFPAYAPGGSTYFGDPYTNQSFPYGQGSEMFTGAEDGYVDPHGYSYHTTTYLGGSDLYSRCFVCGAMGHLTAVCPRYVELLEIPYLPCARPAGGSTEWGHCPNCAMDENLKVKRVQGQKPKTRRERGKEDSETGPWYGLDNGQRQGFTYSVLEEGEFEKRSRVMMIFIERIRWYHRDEDVIAQQSFSVRVTKIVVETLRRTLKEHL